MQFFSKRHFKQCILLSALCVSLSACGTKEYQGEELVSVSESLYEGYIETVDEESGPLLAPEMQALLSVGEIDKNISQEELKLVEADYKHYVKNPRGRVTIERFMYRSLPYLAYTKKVFRERNMPEELAYLAFVESGYNPWAISKAGAVGMWQFMPATGRYCGLAQNWWVDERRDPYKATVAAAKYLQEMYDEFGDWLLALAAYNAGPGKIRRALAETDTDNFFDLMEANENIQNDKIKIKEETQQYVPRFLAMAKIMRNFELLGFQAKENELGKGHEVIAEKAVAIKAQPGSDLRSIAKELGMGWYEFLNYNPAYLRDVTPLTGEMYFYVPVTKEAKAHQVSKMSVVAGWSTYKIARGDTLSGISKKTGVPIHVLRQVNTISEPLRIGTMLKVPATNTYLARNMSNGIRPENNRIYTVQRGDTFGEIAERFGMGVNELKRANPNVRDIRKIALGQKINIPGAKNQHTITAKAPVKTVQVAKKQSNIQNLANEAKEIKVQGTKEHTLQQGETLYSIANRYGLSVDELQALNGNLDPTTLKIGQKIRVRGQAKAVATRSNTPAISGTHIVKKGDTLFSISRMYNINVHALRAVNKEVGNSLNIGQKINLPQGAKQNASRAVAQKKDIIHIVKKGDTLYSIGRNYNVSVQAIMAFNNMKENSLTVGQKLRIPSSNSSVAQTKSVKVYQVKNGDTFWSISQKFGMSTEELFALNNISEKDVLSIGSSLTVYRQ